MVRPGITQEVEGVRHTTSPAATEPAVTPADVTTADATVTTYPVTEAPPLFAGAVQDTTVEPFWNEVPETPVGAPGTVAGVTDAEGSDAGDEPTAFVATTLNRYALPFTRPEIVQARFGVEHTTAPDPSATT